MNYVPSLDTILGSVQKVKIYKKEYITNFFLDIPRMELWIALKLIKYEEIGETVFFQRENNGFNNIFFITTGIASFSRDLDTFLMKYRAGLFVTDIVGKQETISVLTDLLKDKGFYQYTSLVRMSKVAENPSATVPDADSLSYADRQSADEVFLMLNRYFDPIAEQIPLKDEIYKLADDRQVVVYFDELQTIQGFMIFELTGMTSYLRYWFVHPEHREKRIGSALLRKYFYESRYTKRQLFWVIRSNENAIKRYEHFGFKKEELFDYVMINKNASYEG